MRGLARNSAVAHMHLYVGAMLDELIETFACAARRYRSPGPGAPGAPGRRGPDLEDWDVPPPVAGNSGQPSSAPGKSTFTIGPTR